MGAFPSIGEKKNFHVSLALCFHLWPALSLYTLLEISLPSIFDVSSFFPPFVIYSLFTAVDNPELCRVIPDPFRRRHSLFHNILPHFIFFIFIFHKGRRAQICRQFGYCLVRDPRFPLNIWRCTRNESAEKKEPKKIGRHLHPKVPEQRGSSGSSSSSHVIYILRPRKM